MGWFKRLKEGITTSTREKMETPDGVWHKCKQCKETSRTKEVIEKPICIIIFAYIIIFIIEQN